MYRLSGVLVALLLVWGREAASSPASIAAPLFALANQQYFGTADRRAHTSYQVYDDAESALHNILLGAIKPSSALTSAKWLDSAAVQEHQPEVVLVVLGNQLKTSDLRSKSVQKLLAPLQSLLDKAASSVSVPYMLHQDASTIDTAKLQELVAGSAQSIVLGCDEAQQEDLSSQLQHLGSDPAVVVLCTSIDSSITGSAEGLAAELQQLQAAHNAVAALNKPQITVYAPRPDAAAVVQRRRLLQAANADVGTCGELCQTQVKWLEGILAALIMAIAAFSGMCCLYMLDTPTRFEKPKEGARTD
eukprot:GHUV01001586.1.p1 GENE.GHUV01001586.1~~GHUV01001586.1.p1  ORF type:complete len:303 (+),score=87.22 GHUV01001586.1:161-1069(+)